MSLFKEMKIMYSGFDDRPDENYDANELEMGITVEMEHTSDRAIASKIAKDQLDEDAKYYSKMKASKH